MIHLPNLLKTIILGVILLSSTISFAQNKNLLWYTKPAEKWTDALPIGNGRLGAMLFSGVAVDHIQFNEETLWSGKPRNYDRPDAATYLPKIRQLLTEGKQKEAEALAQDKFMGLQSEAGDRKRWVDEMTVDRKPSFSDFDDKLWKTIEVPSYEGWETVGLANLDGAVWFRTSFNMPADWKGKDLVLDLNRIRDQDFTYINGKLVGNTDNTEPRKYTIPAQLLKIGQNTIAVQVLNYFDKGGIAGYKDTKRKIGVYPVGLTVEQGISFVKKWKYKIQSSETPAVAQYQASYQPFGDLNLYFKNHRSPFTNYKRSLDLTTAIASTTYSLNGVNYKREYFSSAVNQAHIVHLMASKPKSISFDAELSTEHQNTVLKALSKNTISISVKVKDGALGGESRLTAIVKNGALKTINGKISIANADEVTLYLTAGTNFINADDVSGNSASANTAALASLKNRTYAQIKLAHIQEYQRYFNTFSINFGPSINEKLQQSL